ncbi:MAG TPA: hypothetical protein VHB50_17415 [Bryobacteraceae bacterium]|nr:hypothetical protein [Bryobacteraceae bacterium]
MFIPGSKNLVIIGAFVAVCGIGAAGWLRKNDRPVDTQIPIAQPVTYGAYQASPPVQDSGPVSADGYYPSVQRPVYVRQDAEAVAPPPPPQGGEFGEPAQPATYAPPAAPSQEQYETRTVYRDRPVYRHGRSKTKSVEIVAGTAAAGAAIGALAGGGKGAALGAISGGGAGFVYDRLTHNR